MKQKDIMIIVVVGVVAAIVSLGITQVLFVQKKSKQLSAEVVSPISSEFKRPQANDTVFNSEAINPTQLIQIGDSSNNNPL